MIIDNENTLFSILANLENNQNLSDITFDDDFVNSIDIRLKIEGTMSDNMPIKGHITTDLLNVCNAWQDAMEKIYASIVKGRDHKRGKVLSSEERERLTLIFKIKEGSTEKYVENIKQILQSFSGMSYVTQAMIIGSIILISNGYFSYRQNEDNNDKMKFLAQNTTVDNAIKMVEKATIEALNSSKLKIENATIGKTNFTKEQIKEIAESMNNEDANIEETVDARFIVTKLYKRGEKKMATLSNNELGNIDASFTKDLFENNEKVFIESFSKEREIECNVYLEKSPNGIIKKATLLALR